MCVLAIVFWFWTIPTWAEDVPPAEEMQCPDGTQYMIGGCYVIFDAPTSKRVFVHTWKHLMQNKEDVWESKDRESKRATEIARVLHGKLMKIPEVSGVRINTRSVLVGVYILDKIPMDAIKKAFEGLE